MRKIPDDNLAYPVLVEIGVSTGSGFYLNRPNGTFLITARHVLYDIQSNTLYSETMKLTCYPKENADSEKNIFIVDLKLAKTCNELAFDQVKDIVILRIGKPDISDHKINIMPYISIDKIAKAGIIGVGFDSIKLYKDVMISNEVTIFGYPISLGIPNIPQIDYSTPLLRSGIVAGKNKVLGTIIIDCPVYPGNSGGPVLEAEPTESGEILLKIIGIVIQFVPTTADLLGNTHDKALVNSGYSIVAAIDGIIDLADKIS